MQFKVPQNITLEDRIAGPLTLVQFIIVVLGGGTAFLFLTLVPIDPINKLGAAFLALLTAIIAVGQFNGQPMYSFFRYIIVFAVTPRTRVWHKTHMNVNLVTPKSENATREQKRATKNISRQDIARLALVLDSRGSVGTPPKSS